MARIERDREDLLAEATALVERVELELVGAGHASNVPNQAEHVVIGFRANGCGSVYFGQGEAYQFNTAGELRRAYRDGDLYKAERGRLVRLTRRRTAEELQLVRHELDGEQTADFLRRMVDLLGWLARALDENGYRVVGQVPQGVDLVAKAAAWLGTLRPGGVAHAPHVR
jgi:hypothetical protein